MTTERPAASRTEEGRGFGLSEDGWFSAYTDGWFAGVFTIGGADDRGEVPSNLDHAEYVPKRRTLPGIYAVQ